MLSSNFEKLTSGIFFATDIVELTYIHNSLLDTSATYKYLLSETKFLDELDELLTAGDAWFYNPTCLEIYLKDNTLQLKRSALINYILQKDVVTFQDIDRNSKLASIELPIQIMMRNVNSCNPDIINNAKDLSVITQLGKVDM